MAKGARNKYKKRLRSAKAAHYYEVKGKAALTRINARLNDPAYSMASEYALPVNAFLEPDNPCAVFPQVKKPDIVDMRSHKIRGGAQCAVGTFRKHLTPNSKKSKYATQVRTPEQIAADEMAAAGGVMTDESAIKVEPVEVKSEKVTQKVMAELAAMTEKMTLDKKSRKSKKSAGDDADMDDAKVPKIKSKAITKSRRDQNRFKKSRK